MKRADAYTLSLRAQTLPCFKLSPPQYRDSKKKKTARKAVLQRARPTADDDSDGAVESGETMERAYPPITDGTSRKKI